MYNIYVCMYVCVCVYCLNTTRSLSHHQNGIITTGALGHTHVQFHVNGIQESKKCSS